MRRPPVRLTAVAALPASLIFVSSPAAQAACAAPSITVTPTSLLPGQQITMRGRDWRTTCNDAPGAVPSDGAKGIRLSFVQDGRTVELGMVDASNDRTFVTKLRIPPRASSGKALMVARGTDRAEAHITILAKRAELPRTGGSLSGFALALVAAAAALVRRVARSAEAISPVSRGR